MVQKTVELVQLLDALVLLARHPLAILANVVAMPAPAKPLVSPDPSADATIMTHSSTAGEITSRVAGRRHFVEGVGHWFPCL